MTRDKNGNIIEESHEYWYVCDICGLSFSTTNRNAALCENCEEAVADCRREEAEDGKRDEAIIRRNSL